MYRLISRTAGTNIGDMTGDGGLAAAFDGNTSQAEAGCASIGGLTGYVGKTLASKTTFGKAVIYASNNNGYSNGAPTITVKIRGKNGAAPSGPTDGTQLGTITFADTSDESAGRTITSTDLVTTWDHLFAEIIRGAGGGNLNCAELVLYNWSQDGALVFFV